MININTEKIHRYAMLNNELKRWYSKKDIQNEYPLSEREIRRRLSKSIIPDNKIKEEKSNRGLPTKLYHHSILDDIFRKRRALAKKESDNTIKWVENHYWKYIGNIVPKDGDVEVNKTTINSIFNTLKLLIPKKSHLKMFYSLELNPEDNNYHTHYLIDCDMSKIRRKDILNILEIYVDKNIQKERRIDLKKYDNSFGKRGNKYTTKCKIIDYKLLVN
jgi:hypothetical protein